MSTKFSTTIPPKVDGSRFIELPPLRFCEELLYRGTSLADLVLPIVSDGSIYGDFTGRVIEHTQGREVYISLTNGTKGNYEIYIEALVAKFDSDHSILSDLVTHRIRMHSYEPDVIIISSINWNDGCMQINYIH